MSLRLLSGLAIGGLRLRNRIAVSPMCQYSAREGCATDWHTVHLGYLSAAGPGLVMLESTAVCAQGRITPSCLGLYSDACEAALARVLAVCRRLGSARLGLQLGHAGRKAALTEPWRGGRPLPPSSRWPGIAPSAVPFSADHAVPRAAGEADLDAIVAAYVAAARRALGLGFDLLEIHAAHGYLLHAFLSPVTNRRADRYGGTLRKRLRFPLEVFEAVRAVWPAERALGVRISGTDWMAGGAGLTEAAVFARALEAAGCDYVTVSSGGISPDAVVPVGPGYQVPLAQEIRRAVRIPVGAVGMITAPRQAEEVLAGGAADILFLGRAFLNDPHWLWRVDGVSVEALAAPPQYLAGAPDRWRATA